MAEELSKKVFELTGKGISQRKVASELGIKRSQVQKVLENTGSTTTKPSTNQSTTGSTGQPVVQPLQPAGSNLKTIEKPLPPGLEKAPPPSEGDREKAEGAEVVERELWLQATPLIKKVILNPKVYLWYDYARSELKFVGDIGDFLLDCVDDFWKSRGWTIKISHEEEVE